LVFWLAMPTKIAKLSAKRLTMLILEILSALRSIMPVFLELVLEHAWLTLKLKALKQTTFSLPTGLLVLELSSLDLPPLPLLLQHLT
jgi:hypothetical protein